MVGSSTEIGLIWILILAISLERFVFSSRLAHCPPSVLFDNEYPCFQETYIICTSFPFNALNRKTFILINNKIMGLGKLFVIPRALLSRG